MALICQDGNYSEAITLYNNNINNNIIIIIIIIIIKTLFTEGTDKNIHVYIQIVHKIGSFIALYIKPTERSSSAVGPTYTNVNIQKHIIRIHNYIQCHIAKNIFF